MKTKFHRYRWRFPSHAGKTLWIYGGSNESGKSEPRAEEQVPGQRWLGLLQRAAKIVGQGGSSQSSIPASLRAATAGVAQQLEQPRKPKETWRPVC